MDCDEWSNFIIKILGVDYYECDHCEECYHCDLFSRCETCDNSMCQYCLDDQCDEIKIKLYRTDEIIKLSDCEKEHYGYEIVECSFCTKDFLIATVSDSELINFVLEKYNLTREELEKQVIGKRS